LFIIEISQLQSLILSLSVIKKKKNRNICSLSNSLLAKKKNEKEIKVEYNTHSFGSKRKKRIQAFNRDRTA
jgi:hypothetical protein